MSKKARSVALSRKNWSGSGGDGLLENFRMSFVDSPSPATLPLDAGLSDRDWRKILRGEHDPAALAEAARLIRTLGYARRNAGLADAEAALAPI